MKLGQYYQFYVDDQIRLFTHRNSPPDSERLPPGNPTPKGDLSVARGKNTNTMKCLPPWVSGSPKKEPRGGECFNAKKGLLRNLSHKIIDTKKGFEDQVTKNASGMECVHDFQFIEKGFLFVPGSESNPRFHDLPFPCFPPRVFVAGDHQPRTADFCPCPELLIFDSFGVGGCHCSGATHEINTYNLHSVRVTCFVTPGEENNNHYIL